MRKSKGNMLVYLLVAVLAVQLYIVFFKDPVKLSKKALKENKILLQGKDPGVPEPVPGKEPEEAGNVQTVLEIGMHARPAVNASHGEGQAMPKSIKSTTKKNPFFPNMPENFKKAFITVDGSEDYYKTLVYGVLILEETDELALTPEQAVRLKKVLELKSQVEDSVPEAQNVLIKNLSDEQLKYIFLQMSRERGGSRPLPPEQLSEYAKKAENALKGRYEKLKSHK